MATQNNNIIPFENLLNNNTHLIICGKTDFSTFSQTLGYYTDFSQQKVSGKQKFNNRKIQKSDNVIIAIDKDFEMTKTLLKKLKKIGKDKNIIAICFGANYKKLQFADVLLYAYNTHYFSQLNMAQVIAGTIKPKGVTVPKANFKNKVNTSFKTIRRLKYTIAEQAGFDSRKLQKLDTLMLNAIIAGATPGAQILAAKNGKVFLYKSYGYHTYSDKRQVKNSDLYDVASITKLVATTFAAMKLYEAGKIKLKDSIKYYIDDTINCTIKNHQLADFFIHKTGLPVDMPILKYISYADSVSKRYDKYYSEKRDSTHTIKLTNSYYLRRDYLDSIVASLYNLEIDTSKDFKYSDINFNIIYDILCRNIEGSYTQFLNNNIYNPMQLRYSCFLPLKKFKKAQIVPTQDDRFWRRQLIHGTPHDESAAIYGGVAGNAGLFSNANDLAIMMQTLLNGGTYGNVRIFERETVRHFMSVPKGSKRAYGFCVNKGGAFGHTGFTGCVVWANPRTNFVFVFLSNSIHPWVMNKKLKRMKIRKKAYNIVLQSYLK